MKMVGWHRWLAIGLAACCLGCASVPATPPAPAPAAPPPVNTGPATIVVGQQPCCPKQTLPEFLGLTGLCKAGGALLTRIRARLGMRFPGLEGRPPLLPITDPANMDSSNPAVSAAAEIKAQEDAAAQKIKGLRYLATIGCGGCYPDVEQALLAGLDDCTEAVRYEAAAALRSTAGNPCQFCRDTKCCSAAVQKKLREVAFGMTDNGCYQEPSARTRRMARLALAGCGCLIEEEPESPLEGPEGPGGAEETAGAPRSAAPQFATDGPMHPTGPMSPVSTGTPASATVPAVEFRPLPAAHPMLAPPAPCPTCAPTNYLETPYPPIGQPSLYFYGG